MSIYLDNILNYINNYPFLNKYSFKSRKNSIIHIYMNNNHLMSHRLKNYFHILDKQFLILCMNHNNTQIQNNLNIHHFRLDYFYKNILCQLNLRQSYIFFNVVNNKEHNIQLLCSLFINHLYDIINNHFPFHYNIILLISTFLNDIINNKFVNSNILRNHSPQ